MKPASIVAADALHFDWPARWEDLAAAHFEFLLTLRPEIVLLGSGARQKFPHPALLRSLSAARIGLEAMDTPAACRTYNILIAEGRNVIAAVMMAETVRVGRSPLQPAQHLEMRGRAAAQRMQVVTALEQRHDAPTGMPFRHLHQLLRDPGVISLDQLEHRQIVFAVRIEARRDEQHLRA